MNNEPELVTIHEAQIVDRSAAELIFTPLKLTHYLGFKRQNLWWYMPLSGVCGEPVNESFQFLLCRNVVGEYFFVLPINSTRQRLFIHLMGEHFYLGDEFYDAEASQESMKYVVVHGMNPYRCIELGLAKLRTHTAPTSLADHWHTLGWCTWDAFYKEVTAKGIRDGLASLKQIGHTPGYMIIDDGWQATKRQLLTSFATDTERFGEPLKTLIPDVKQEYGVKVGVWHALFGYWAGVAHQPNWPSHWSFLTNTLRLWEGDHDYTSARIADSESIGEWYYSYHGHLAGVGADFVKVDGQAFMERLLVSPANVDEVARSYQFALGKSVAAHFNGQGIHCMAHEASILKNAKVAIWRNSDDYIPRDDADHGLHILINCFNNLWSSQLGCPDWDMFQTPHQHSEYHAIARAVSGGPIYISDAPGAHNPELLRRLTTSGNELLLADGYALPVESSLFNASTARSQLVTVCNSVGDAGVLGIFNCQNYGEPLNGSIGATDLIAMPDCDYAVFSYRDQHADLLPAGDRWWVTLPSQSADILTFAPIKSGFAVLGIAEKYLGRAAVTEMNETKSGLGFSVRCEGTLVFCCFVPGTVKLMHGRKRLDVVEVRPSVYQAVIPKAGKCRLSIVPAKN